MTSRARLLKKLKPYAVDFRKRCVDLFSTSPDDKHQSMRRVLRAALLSLILVVVIFPDVFFSRSSLRMTDQRWAVFSNAKASNIYPVFSKARAGLAYSGPDYMSWYSSGLNDPGGAMFQSEPMMEFMRYNLRTWNSPYWNPFSAAGSLGPETLVDLKFSVFTLAYAALGGGTFVYDCLTIFGFWLGIFFVIRICEVQLGLSWMAGVAAGILYVLNGFSIANIASNVAQSYLLVPWCLYASFGYAERQSTRRFALMAISFAALMSFTFLPTTIVEIGAIVLCTAGFALSICRRASVVSMLGRVLLGQAAAGVVAFVSLSFIYLPILENLASTGTLEMYQARIFFPASLRGFLSFLSPSHFFESYQSAEEAAKPFVGNTVYHFGVIGLAFACSAWSRPPQQFKPLVIAASACVIVVLGRIFGVFGFTQLFELLPIVKSLGEQYIWVAVSIPLVLLVGIGADNLIKGTASRIPFYVLACAAVISALYIQIHFGIHPPGSGFKVTSLVLMVCFGIIFFFASSPRYRAFGEARTLITIIFMFLELTFYSKSVRFPAHDFYNSPTTDVEFVKANIGLSRTMTFGAYATSFEYASAFQLQEVTSLNQGPLLPYSNYFREMIHGLPASMRFGEFLSLAMPQPEQRMDYFDWRKVDLLGVKYIILPSSYTEHLKLFSEAGYPIVHVSKFSTIVENKRPFPRAFLIDDQPGSGANVTISTELKATDVAPIEISKYRNAELLLQGNASRPSVAVLTDNWHANWSATVNGKHVDIVTVDGVFRGVRVPPGAFVIEMSYAPKTLSVAILLSTFAALALVGLLFERQARNYWNRATETTGDARDGIKSTFLTS